MDMKTLEASVSFLDVRGFLNTCQVNTLCSQFSSFENSGILSVHRAWGPAEHLDQSPGGDLHRRVLWS